MSFTYTQSGPSPVGTLNLNSAHLKLTFQDKKLIFFNDVSLGAAGSNLVASNAVQAPGFQFANTASNGLIYATNGVFNTAGSDFSISGNTLSVPNLSVSGNLTVNGTFTTINTTTLVITDPIVQIGANVTDTSNVGLILTSGPSYSNVAFGFQPGMNAVVLTGTSDSAYGPTMTPTSNVNFIVYGNVSAAAFIGNGSGLTNVATSSNLQAVTTIGAITDRTVTFSNVTTGISVSSNVIIGGNIEMASGNMNVYSISTYSIAADTINATNFQGTLLSTTGDIVGHANLIIDGKTTSGSLQVAGLSALGNVTASGTLGVTGLSTLGNVTASGTLGVTGLSTLGNVTASGTLGVTGLSTLGNVTASGTLGVTGLSTLGNVTASGTLGVTGNVSVSNITASGTLRVTGPSVLGNVTASGTLGVTGNVSASNITATGKITGGFFSGDGGGLSNIAGGTSNLQVVTQYGAVSDQAISFTNLNSIALTIPGTASIKSIDSNIITSNVLVTDNILADDVTVTGDLTVDGITTVQILKFTPYSGIDIDSGNTAVVATATANVVTVTATGVAYGSNVIDLSAYTGPISSFNLTIDDNAQLYLFAPGVSVNTTSTSTVKFTNPAVITTSNVLFHVTKITNAGFSVVNAIVVD